MMRRMMWVCGMMALLASMVLPAAAQSGSARVRVIHAAPDAPKVDVFVDNTVVLRDVGFLDVSKYLDVAAGARSIAVAPTGQGVGAAVVTANPSVEAGKAYTIAVVGTDTLQAQVYNDNVAPVADGKVRVRAVHTLADAPAVDVEVIGGPTLFEQITFPNASDYAEVDAGTYDLQLVATGANTVFVQWNGTKLDAGTIYDIVVFGSVANLQTRVAVTTPGSADLGGSAPAPPVSMPDTGAETTWSMLLLVAGLLLCIGAASRRWARS